MERNISQKLLYNKSFGKRNNIFDSNKKFEAALINLKEGLNELSNEYLDKKNVDKDKIRGKSIEKVEYPSLKYKYNRARTPKKIII